MSSPSENRYRCIQCKESEIQSWFIRPELWIHRLFRMIMLEISKLLSKNKDKKSRDSRLQGADQSFPISIGLMIYQELCPVEPVKHKRNWPTSFCFNWDRVLVDSSTIYLLNHNVYKYTFFWGHGNIHKVDPYSAPRTLEAHKYKNAYQPSNISGRPSCQCQLLHLLIMYLRNIW